MNYILNKATGEIKEVGLQEWVEWSQKDFNETRRIALDTVGHYQISTVFLGLDHGFGQSLRPVLFETMIFDLNQPTRTGGYKDVYMMRYTDMDMAEREHKFFVDKITELLSQGMLPEIYTLDGEDNDS